MKISATFVYENFLEREAQNSDEHNYSIMNQRRRMPDDDAGHYRALKCKLQAGRHREQRFSLLDSGEVD